MKCPECDETLDPEDINGWKTSYPGLGTWTCRHCNHSIAVWQGNNGKVHSSPQEAIASDRQSLAAIKHCTICGELMDGPGITAGHDVKVCRPCYVRCKAQRLGIWEATKHPELLK